MSDLAKITIFLLLPVFAQAEWYEHEDTIFGTNFSMSFWAETNESARQAIDLVNAEMWRLHHMLSPYEESSELSKVNNRAFSTTVYVSDEFAMLIERALYFSELSEGAFDPSFSTVGRHYDYQAAEKPSKKKLENLIPDLNYRNIVLDKKNLSIRFSNPNLHIDLGGIAKGYAVDRAVEILEGLGIQRASVSAGGDMRVIGDRLERPWIVGIKNPRSEKTAIRLPLADTAISTSGDYERYFIDQESNERIHHILNPVTGESAGTVASVTVLGEKGLDTDPLSTALFVIGVERGLKLMNSMNDFDAIIIDSKGKVHFSEGLVEP